MSEFFVLQYVKARDVFVGGYIPPLQILDFDFLKLIKDCNLHVII